MARKMARVARRTAEEKPSRGYLTSREHKDLSTAELNCRIEAKRAEAQTHEQELARLTGELNARRKAAKALNEDVAALEALVEGRR